MRITNLLSHVDLGTKLKRQAKRVSLLLALENLYRCEIYILYIKNTLLKRVISR